MILHYKDMPFQQFSLLFNSQFLHLYNFAFLNSMFFWIFQLLDIFLYPIVISGEVFKSLLFLRLLEEGMAVESHYPRWGFVFHFEGKEAHREVFFVEGFAVLWALWPGGGLHGLVGREAEFWARNQSLSGWLSWCPVCCTRVVCSHWLLGDATLIL